MYHKLKKKSKQFITLIEHGKVSAALRTVGSERLIVLDIPPSVMNELKKKHPKLQKATEGSIIQGPSNKKLVEDVVFEKNDAKNMHNATGKVNVADGPSGRDANLCGIGFCVLDS